MAKRTNNEMPKDDAWIRVGSLEELMRDGVKLIKGKDRPIAVFAHQGKAFAVDNRCPHLGFPLTKGTVHDGILTCHWHQARFDLCSGCTFDLWADDVPSFATRVDQGVVHVAALLNQESGRFQRQLVKGLTQNIGLLQAKGIVGLLAEGASASDLIKSILAFGVEHQNTAQGMTELAIAGNLAPALGAQSLYFALFRASQQVAQASNNSRRLFREPLAGETYDLGTLRRWFEQWIEVRDRDGAERVLLTAIAQGATPAQLADMMVGADSQRLFSAQGHPIDFINKAMELLDFVGWEHAAKVLPLALPNMAAGRGAEEDSHWRHPINLVALVRDAESKLEAALARPRNLNWTCDETTTLDVLLGDDPAAIIKTILAALEAGAPPHEISQRVAYAGALRLARFAHGNEVGDWFNPQHTFTTCNAVDQLIRRSPTPRVVRALLHVALAVYSDRFLNIPPAKLPDESSDHSGLPESGELLAQLLRELDGRSLSNTPARLVSRYLSLSLPLRDLIETLATCTLREDLDFHTLQILDAGVRQARQWGEGEQATRIFVGVIRNLAAVCPTPRARLKTATTALKLHHGESMHEET